jgi:hypothetical protein
VSVPTGTTARLELEGVDAIPLEPGEHYYFRAARSSRAEKRLTRIL